jgi:hypothetical protein
MKNFILVTLIFATGCDHFAANMKRDSWNGLRVFVESGQQYSPQDFDFALESLYLVMEQEGIVKTEVFRKYVDEHINEYIFVIRAEPAKYAGFKCDYFDGVRCLGEFISPSLIEPGKIQFVGRKCIFDTSFVHEMLHFYEFYSTGKVDQLHGDYTMFKLGCGFLPKERQEQCIRSSVENIANTMFKGFYCTEKE